jgi:hypothetical protein
MRHKHKRKEINLPLFDKTNGQNRQYPKTERKYDIRNFESSFKVDRVF